MLFNISTSVYYYQAKRSDDSEVIEQLSILADLHRTWGFWMMYHRLRKLQFMWNHKRVYRIYTSMRLNLRNKRKKRLPARVKAPLFVPLDQILHGVLILCTIHYLRGRASGH